MRCRRADASLRVVLAATWVTLLGCSGEAPALEAPPEDRPNELEGITRAAESGDVHLVRLVQRGDRYGFEPEQVTLTAGDVLRFVMVGAQPESVVFDPQGATPEAAAYILQNNLHMGVLLTDTGQAHDVSFRDAPPGTYPFASIPHGSQGMRGSVVIAPPG